MANGTRFVMCYGADVSGKTVCSENPWGVYTGVWHLNETGTASSTDTVTIHDSTNNELDGITPAGHTASGSVVGGAWRIAEDNNHDPGIIVEATNDTHKALADALGTDFHASFWFRAKGSVPYSNLIGRRKGDDGKSWGFLFYQNSGTTPKLVRVCAGSTIKTPTSTDYNLGATLAATDDVWKKIDIVWRYASNNGLQIADIYLDGAYLETVTCSEKVELEDTNIGIGCSTQDVYAGTKSNPPTSEKGRRVNGEMDEVRLGAFVPDADWIAADYATQKDANFLSNDGAKAILPSVLLVAGESVGPAPSSDEGLWFDAGIPSLFEWPSDGSDVPVASNGTWTGTAGATLVAARRSLDVSAVDGAMLAFVPGTGRTATESASVTFLSTVSISAIAPVDRLAPLDSSAKAGLAVAENAAGAARYYAWAKDPDGPTNVWRELDGATPAVDGTPVSLRAVATLAGGDLAVRYEAGGAVLSAGGTDALPVAADDGDFNYVGMLGDNFEVSSLVAGTGQDSVALTFPAMPEGLAILSVTANGVPVDPGEGGVYAVASGSSVVVAFEATGGYELDGPATLFLAPFADIAVPVESLPKVVHPHDLVRISEAMASNPSVDKGGITSGLGIAEMDWIELYNGSSQDIDATGWYLSDNDKAGKETKATILGSCVIPAHGYKIVWLDKLHVDPSEYGPDEAFSVLKLSSGGDLVQLARPDGSKVKVVDKIDFKDKKQIKGVSYGPGIVSYGPYAGTATNVYMRTATPGAPNVSEGWWELTPTVYFSEPHGWKTQAFDLELVCSNMPNADIYYTLDGTSPTTGSTLYTGPIRVERTTVVRAAVPIVGSILQFDTSATYLFLDDILSQGRSTTAPGRTAEYAPDVVPWFPNTKERKSQVLLYGLDQGVVNGDDRDRLLRGFTNSIATISIVVDPENLFNSSTGIYVNPKGEGREWERQAMLEGFDPTGAAEEFSLPAGLRIRGGNSRNTGWPKHSLRLFFRSEYGESSLSAKLFPGEKLSPNGEGKLKEEIGEYDKFDLRTSQNLSWANAGLTMDTFVTGVFARDSQRDMGQPYTRSRYYNLFINGQYWGLYQTQERADEHFGEAYLGGDSLQYDLIKASSTYASGKLAYEIECNEGTWDAWSNLWAIATQEGFGEGHEDNYNRVLGLDANGVRDPSLPILVNPESLMSFIFSSHFMVDQDGPTSPYSGIDIGHANNFNALRNRDDAGAVCGFVFLRHDAEVSMNMNGGNTAANNNPTYWGTEAQTSPPVQGSKDLSGLGAAKFREIPYFTPAELHYLLMQNPTYRREFADAFYRFFLRDGGAMTTAKNIERYAARMAEIDDAIVCEQARWAQKGQTRSTWLDACTTATNFIKARISNMTQQYKTAGWYPTVEPPIVEDESGSRYFDGDEVPYQGLVCLSNGGAGGEIYYTTNGISDPMDAGVLYAGGFPIPDEGFTVRARVFKDNEWSPLEEVALEADVPNDQRYGIRVAAILNAAVNDPADEFVLLTNKLDRGVQLEGLSVWSEKKGQTLTQLAEITNAVAIAAHGTFRLTSADWLFDSTKNETRKLKNGEIYVELRDYNGKRIQNVRVNSEGWFRSVPGDKNTAACNKTGRWFIALESLGDAEEGAAGGDVTQEDQWRPSFAMPKDTSAVPAVYAALDAIPEIEGWLDELDGTEDGHTALTNFAGTARALETCYLVGIVPETDPEVALTIPEISFDAAGKPVVKGSLSFHGVTETQSRKVRGSVRFYYSDSVTNLNDSERYIQIDPPILPTPEEPGTLENEDAPAVRFYRLKIEK